MALRSLLKIPQPPTPRRLSLSAASRLQCQNVLFFGDLPPIPARCLEARLPPPSSQKPRSHGLSRLTSRVHAGASSSLGGEEPDTEGPQAALAAAAPTWIERWIPAWLRPYALLARVDRPVGIWLFFWPCAWSMTMAANPGELPDAKLLALLLILSVFVRGAACTVNDLFDRDIDKKVARTRSRPLACGALTPLQAVFFFWFQVLAGAGVLLVLNNCSRILGAFLLPLLSTYPLMKRITYWPQVYLGFGANGGALLGWAAVKGSLDPAITLPLYVAGLFWTLMYDTIYAHQDVEDDIKAGVRSTAVKFGSSAMAWITGFAVACVGALVLSGYYAKLAWPYYAFLAVAAGQFGWQILTVDLTNGPDCNNKFISNVWFGAFVFLGVLLGRLVVP